MAAINKPQPPLPMNSADVEAADKLKAHVRVGIKPSPSLTRSNGAQGAKLAGRKVSGGSTIRGGKA